MDDTSRTGAGPDRPHDGPGGDEVFEVRVAGAVEDDTLDQLGPLDISSRELRTSLRGRFRDQAELHGFLARLRTFGLEIVEVRRLPPDPGGTGS